MYQVHITVHSRIPKEREAILNDFKELLTEIVMTGAKRIRDNYTTTHVPSNPGEPPAVRTGYLRRSTQGKRVNAQFESFIEIEAFYSEYLEFGTYRIAPRPFVRPEVQRLEYDIPRMAERKFAK